MFTMKEYEDGDAIAFSWHIEDVLSLDASLTVEQARVILANFNNHHEGSQDAMWADLQYHIDDFKVEQEIKEDS